MGGGHTEFWRALKHRPADTKDSVCASGEVVGHQPTRRRGGAALVVPPPKPCAASLLRTPLMYVSVLFLPPPPAQIIDAIYEQDPNGATLAFADMMKKQIVMPAHLMDDGEHETLNTGRNLFAVSGLLGWGDGSFRSCGDLVVRAAVKTAA